MFKNLPLLIALIALISGCSTTKKISTLIPEPGNDQPLVYETSTSFIALPIQLKIKDIENQANKNLNGLIYDDPSMDKDNLELKVWKTADFKVSNVNGKLQTVLPLKISGKYRYGTSVMGLDLYDTKEFNMSGVITLSSMVSIVNWKLGTTTTIDKLDWTESPSIIVGGKSIALTYLINPAVKLFKGDIGAAIDKAIRDASDFKPQVMDALSQLSNPIQLDPVYQTWFRITPQEVYSTEMSMKPDAIAMNMGLKCTMETFIGKQPTKQFEKDKVVLKPVKSMPDKFTISLAAVTGYEEAAALINKNFQGQEFTSGKRKITVNKVDLWQKEGKLIVALDVAGSITGKIYLSGIPQYSKERQEIFIDQLDFVLDTKSKLMRSASWIAQGLIIKKIQENCKYSIKADLEQARKTMQPYLKNYSPTKGVIINGSMESLDFDNIKLSNRAIVAFITSTGTMDVVIDGL